MSFGGSLPWCWLWLVPPQIGGISSLVLGVGKDMVLCSSAFDLFSHARSCSSVQDTACISFHCFRSAHMTINPGWLWSCRAFQTGAIHFLRASANTTVWFVSINVVIVWITCAHLSAYGILCLWVLHFHRRVSTAIMVRVSVVALMLTTMAPWPAMPTAWVDPSAATECNWS